MIDTSYGAGNTSSATTGGIHDVDEVGKAALEGDEEDRLVNQVGEMSSNDGFVFNESKSNTSHSSTNYDSFRLTWLFDTFRSFLDPNSNNNDNNVTVCLFLNFSLQK